MLQGGIWRDENGVWCRWFGSKRYDRNSSCLRHIRTTQERRANGNDDGRRRWTIDGFDVCGRRRVKGLPEYRDEIFRDYDSTRSWKHNRRQQWKGAK